jgi:hypothetical protein
MNKCFQDFYIQFYQLIVGHVETEQSRKFHKAVMVEVRHLAAADIQYLKVRNVTYTVIHILTLWSHNPVYTILLSVPCCV